MSTTETLTITVTTPEGEQVLVTEITGQPDLDAAHNWATTYHNTYINCVVTLTYKQVIAPKGGALIL
jgi:hypothetical protein